MRKPTNSFSLFTLTESTERDRGGDVSTADRQLCWNEEEQRGLKQREGCSSVAGAC